MFKPDQIISLSKLNNRQIAGAIKIGAAILASRHGVTEAAIKAMLKLDELGWTDLKAGLKPFFTFRIGRVDFIREDQGDERPAPWELLTDADIVKMDEKRAKTAAKRSAPLTPPQEKLYALGGFTEQEAKRFWFQMSNIYGAKALEQAIDIATEKKPGQPKGYILSILKTKAAAASGDTVQKRTFPLRVPAFTRPVNPEAAHVQFLGWEAMVKTRPDGGPDWGQTGRRKVFRLAGGEARFEQASPTEIPPSHADDPGVLVI